MSSSDTPTWGPLRSFGRIRSRTLKPRQAALFDSLLPTIALPDPEAGPIDPAALMPGASDVWLEIGFGGGEHLAEQARRNPGALMIGCEPFLNGVGSALRHIEEGGLGNVRLHAGDARSVMSALPDGSLERVMILFPDPWPKARHNKRRFIQPETAAEIVGRKAERAYVEHGEEAAFRLGGGEFSAPAQRAGDFLQGTAGRSFGSVQPTYRPAVKAADLRGCLPGFKWELELSQALY
jgi:tRNA G46 methylase TrmB